MALSLDNDIQFICDASSRQGKQFLQQNQIQWFIAEKQNGQDWTNRQKTDGRIVVKMRK